MNKPAFKVTIFLAICLIITGISCSRVPEKSEKFTVQITDKPLTYCNPINLSVGSERARRAGEPIVTLYKDDYYLFVTGGRGYWYSDNMRDWTYVSAPNFPGGVLSVAAKGETLYACSMN